VLLFVFVFICVISSVAVDEYVGHFGESHRSLCCVDHHSLWLFSRM